MKPRTLVAVIVLLVLVVGAALAAAQGIDLAPAQQSTLVPQGAPETSAAPQPGPPPTNATTGRPDGIPNDAWRATVTSVHDGDTLYLDDEKVRLIGVDTPEIGEHGECYGDEARALLRDLLPEGEPVWAIEDREPYDHYDRALLYLFTDDGIFVNLELVELGSAEAIRVGVNDAYWPELRDAERAARDAGLGMWGAC